LIVSESEEHVMGIKNIAPSRAVIWIIDGQELEAPLRVNPLRERFRIVALREGSKECHRVLRRCRERE